MIAQTNAFLNWALETECQLPRVPARPVEHGGFDYLRYDPAARARADHWWEQTLDGDDWQS